MSKFQKLSAAALALLWVGALTLWWHTGTQPAIPHPAALIAQAGRSDDQVDRSAYNAALQLKPLADSANERALAEAAMRLADHDLDLAYTTALRQLDAHPPTPSAAAARIGARLERSDQLFADHQRHLEELTGELAHAAPERSAVLLDGIGLEQTQLELDQYEIEQANQDLDAAGGNLRARIAAESQEREQLEKLRAAQPALAAAPLRAASGIAERGGMKADVEQWRSLAHIRQQLQSAQREAVQLAAALFGEHETLARKLEAQKSALNGPPATAALAPNAALIHESSQTRQVQTQSLAADQGILNLLEQRVRAQRSLGEVYAAWDAELSARQRAAAHALIGSAMILIIVLFVLLFLDRWLIRVFARGKHDRRRIETLHKVTRTVLQLLAVIIALLVLLGVPSQFGTVLGIIGAGLTVALKDFIVAFIGWVVLMGKNGIRLGDWVEINGVSGEVIELGMFHTVLLETGSWGDAGHPTGRRVTFTNSFAIAGHYFNFSTSGQWLWDELKVVVPAGKDPQPFIEALREQVSTATAESARQAEQEWQRAVPSQVGRAFSGTPGINAKPVVGGVELSVRYITRAEDRFQLRAQLYQAAVNLLGRPGAGNPS